MHLLEDRLKYSCLGGEVVVQRTGRDAGLAGDVLDGGSGESVSSEQSPSGCHQRRPRLRHLLGAQ